jgi:predicted Zn-dependent peptidase
MQLAFRILCFVLVTFAAQAQEWKAPTAMKKLANGLTVVVSEDHSAPTFGLCVSYGIGFRLEPQGRTGFAHLFEHMMFEGTPNAPKGVFDRVIEGGGGFNNGDTRYDFTEYIESGPISTLEPMLWLEADRMKTLDFSVKNLDNQRNVVEEEVRVNVLNQPYGSFFWLDLPQKAFDTYPNAHNFYGDFKDLDTANIEDVRKFYESYYAPNNAVLAIVGDVNTAQMFASVEKYFSPIASRPTPPRPNVTEPPQKSERRATETDKLSTLPALAVGYRMPPRGSPDAIVAAVTGELLHNGEASALYQALVKQKQVATSISGGVNWPLGNPFEYNGPTLMTSFIEYPQNVTEDQLLAGYDAVIADLARSGPSRQELDRVATKMRADWYGQLEVPVNRASALSHAALFDGSFDSVYQVPDLVAKVTPEQVRDFAAKYLVPTNRTIINRVPVAQAKPGSPSGGKR